MIVNFASAWLSYKISGPRYLFTYCWVYLWGCFWKISAFLLLFCASLCTWCMCGHMCQDACMEVSGQFWGFGFHLPPLHGFHNLGLWDKNLYLLSHLAEIWIGELNKADSTCGCRVISSALSRTPNTTQKQMHSLFLPILLCSLLIGCCGICLCMLWISLVNKGTALEPIAELYGKRARWGKLNWMLGWRTCSQREATEPRRRQTSVGILLVRAHGDT